MTVNAAPETTALPRQGTLSIIWQGLTRNKSGFAGAVIVLLILGLAYIGPFLIDRHNPSDGAKVWQAPSAEHLLGTNLQGKDTLIKVILGGAEPLWVGILAALIAVGVAVVVGSVAGYFRGKVDTVALQLTDITLTIPGIVLMLVLTTMYRSISATAIAVIIGVTTAPVLVRSIRAQVMSLKEREFVEAARLQNLGAGRIIFTEILPNMGGYIFVNFILAINNAIYALVGMYLLGLLPSTADNWGLMIYESWNSGAFRLPRALPYIAVPLALIILFQIGLVAMSRSLEQALNPRLRER
ncbi:peptide/nickel transport system permease protein [Stackebrandtia albiflava]|uniref:Peptide/nickel transport system permease protein n=1 Tax=Stackebrandtia albiflava TaxID=406432 RepID=A0A562UY02_9ACTN|nr:ABC transporter permease [Stackebrandtia albiflava]TWJ10511.1 peptide/nickel transport system permease protein [Stackebrandtia albiflava]